MNTHSTITTALIQSAALSVTDEMITGKADMYHYRESAEHHAKRFGLPADDWKLVASLARGLVMGRYSAWSLEETDELAHGVVRFTGCDAQCGRTAEKAYDGGPSLCPDCSKKVTA